MASDWIETLKVAELKDELKKRDLPVGGKKAELAARLEAFVVANEQGEAQAHGGEAEVEVPVEQEKKGAQAQGGEAEVEVPMEQEKEEKAQPAVEPVEEQQQQQEEQEEVQDPAVMEEEEPQQQQQQQQKEEEFPMEEEAKQEVEEAKEPVDVAVAAPDDDTKPAGVAPVKNSNAPEKRKRDDDIDNNIEKVGDDDKRQKMTAPEEGKTADVTTTTAAIAEDQPRPAKQQKTTTTTPTTRALLIENFVRPFTLNAARDLLSRTGTVVAMWMPQIKNLAVVVYATKAEAEATRSALDDLKWPDGSPKTLKPRYMKLHEAEEAIKAGEGAEFTIERTDEDASPEEEEEEEEEEMPKQGDKDANVNASEDEKAKSELPSSAVVQVKDLRTLLSRKLGTTANEREKGKVGMPVEKMNSLFKRTTAEPAIYWLPVSKEAAEAKKREMAQNQRRR